MICQYLRMTLFWSAERHLAIMLQHLLPIGTVIVDLPNKFFEHLSTFWCLITQFMGHFQNLFNKICQFLVVDIYHF